MKRLEDVDHIVAVESVEVGDESVELSDKLWLLLLANGRDGHPTLGRPLVVSIIHRCEACSNSSHGSTPNVVPIGKR